MRYPYQTLVLKGGGVKGIAYVGAVKALAEASLLPQLEYFAGTSAGSIVAGLLASGWTHDDLKEVFMALDFSSFEDHWDPLRLPTRYGLYEGAYFLEWMTGALSRRLGKANPTFRDLPLGLSVFSTNVSTRSLAEFSTERTPGMPVSEAVRCSMSIPFVFAAHQFQGQLYVDGGVLLNYPFPVLEQRDSNSVLGLFLDDLQHKRPATYDVKYDDVVPFVKGLFETLVGGQQTLAFRQDSVAQHQTVRIDDEGISATDFAITQAQKQLLYGNGYRDTKQFLAQLDAKSPQ